MSSITLPRCCVGVALKQLIKSQYRPVLSNGKRYSPCLPYSTYWDKPKVLGVSSVTQQDGLEFQELPILVRHLEKNMLPLSYTTENEAKVDECDEYIKTQLQSCKSVQDILKKLEIPTEGLTGLSAAFTLQRIWQLKETSISIHAESYIEARFLKELYSMIEKNISSFSDEILISLVQGYSVSDSFQANCTQCIGTEIQKRLGDFKFSVLELCILSNILSKSNTDLNHLIELIWVHMCHRTDINENNLATVFLCLPKQEQKLSTSVRKNVKHVLVNRFTKTWWFFSGKELGCLSIALNVHNMNYWQFYDFISKWMYVNVNTIDASDLMQIVSVFLSQKVKSTIFLESLEKFILAQGLKMDLNLLAMTMEYFCSLRYFSREVLDMVARIFIKHGETFSTLQLYSILRQFGHFNYRESPYLDEVFKIAETVIDRKFDQFELLHICQLLCSFTYIDRFPVNFASKMLTSSFWFKCKAVRDKGLLEKVAIREICESNHELIRRTCSKSNDSLDFAELDEVHTCLSSLEYSMLVKENIPITFRYHMRNQDHAYPVQDFKEETSYPGQETINSFRFPCNQLKKIVANILKLPAGRQIFPLSRKMKKEGLYGFVLAVKNNNWCDQNMFFTDYLSKFSKLESGNTDDFREERLNDSPLAIDRENRYRKSYYRNDKFFKDPDIKKIVFLLYPEHYYCSNERTLLGKYEKIKEMYSSKIPNSEFIAVNYDEVNYQTLREKLQGISKNLKDLPENVPEDVPEVC